MEYTFIKGREEDVSSICSMVKCAIEKMDSEGIFQWDETYPSKADFEEDIKNKELYMLKYGKEIAAIVVLQEAKTDFYEGMPWAGDKKEASEIHRVCVNPKFQNKGVGKILLAESEKELRLMGFKSIRMDVFENNPYAQKLYAKIGFKALGKDAFVNLMAGKFLFMEKSL